MFFWIIITACLVSTISLTITEPVDGESYDSNLLPLRVIVENENELPDSVMYTLNGAPAIQIPRLNTDWPTYMQNYQNHGFSESPAPMNSDTLWSAEVTGFLHQFPTPVTSEGVVYYPQDDFGEDSLLYALDAITGEILWQRETGASDDAVTIHGDYLYYSASTVFCLNKHTGETIWTSDHGNAAGGTPVVVGNRVYCGKTEYRSSIISFINCLDTNTGDILWSDTVSGTLGSCMAYQDGLLIVPIKDGLLYAYDGVSGEVLWQNSDAVSGYWDSSPVITDGHIFINDFDGYCRAVELLTGLTVWETKVTEALVTATPALFNGSLYFATEDGPFYSLDCTSGDIRWEAPGQCHGSAGIADGVIFYGKFGSIPPDSSAVIALSIVDGSELWRFNTLGSVMGGLQSSPSITDGIMYYACTDGNLYAFGTGLKYTYKDDSFNAETGSNTLIAVSWDDGNAVAADTISFTVTQAGMNLEPSRLLRLLASPNPFISNTSITFKLDEPGSVSLQVFDLAGRAVISLVNQEMATGEYSLNWNGFDQNGEEVSAGLYLCRIECGSVIETTGLCLLK